ncbi:transcription antitermination factor NusB [Novosphingobium aerophilum]|uniref:transcription antitermination factor NusB n=1 Tax=Novosphingobium TaxID=165696 RepID=UPI0006C850E7|nr:MULTISPECIES: transcription antitermination factor NusB [unclassified Novosphingobium]KPH58695.1 antitermination protein NusB [Novosphingobium sp. ST904]MPS70638.1 transcription antitermination factor NusB [Novosphingobium sp.]TCM42176.1 NusB antitermination factor [Novosphingobium sp. ST904]WRT91444.1 transcription antitermination factor NusB [Novosphingobium sp. RL4]
MSNSKQAGSKQARAAARLAAVQALYQFDMEGTLLPTLLDEFHRHRLGMTIDEEEYAKAEVAFFDDVVKGVISRRDEIDELLSGKLAEGWALPRLDKTMLQILRAGTYELLARADVPTGAAISEYLDVAHAFFDAREAKFVNGVLDAVAKVVR